MSSVIMEEEHQGSEPNRKTVERIEATRPEYNDGHTKLLKKVQKVFLICESCFWCASFYDFYGEDDTSNQYARCPACGTETVESLPISSDESYRFDYNPTTGVILEFLR